MNYSIIFTIYGLVFAIMLLITFLIKKNKITIRKKLYLTLIVSSTLFALAESIACLLFFNITQNQLIFSIFWKIRMICIFIYLIALTIYYDTLMNGEKYNSLKEIIFKSKKNLFTTLFLTIVAIIYTIFVNYTISEKTEIVFINGYVGLGVLVMVAIICLYLFITAYKIRKERKNVSICFYLIVLIFTLVTPLQMYFIKISFMPFLTMFILYIMYHNIENPDLELLENITEFKEDIEKSSNAKTDFLFKLSYNLLNPINVILSLSDSLCNITTFEKEEIIRDLNSIKYAGNTLLDSIDNILALSETDEEDNQIINKEYSVYELINRMKTVATTRIGEKPIEFELDISDNVSSKLMGDITKIQKVLINILTNAAKYTEIGKIKMTVTCTSNKDTYMLNFRISDTGNGIKEENQQYIFEDKKDSETAGLGLALSKRYIESMNGTIKFKSVYGAGTTFVISIPQKVIGTKLILEDKRDASLTQKIEILDCSNYKALIVDDDELDIKVTKRMLEKYKFNITTITSTSDCIDRIKQDEKYDLIFLDHKMPEIDGMQTMKILKKLNSYEIPPIVALTANAVAGAREIYLNEGFDYYLSKPIDVDELDFIIKKTFKK